MQNFFFFFSFLQSKNIKRQIYFVARKIKGHLLKLNIPDSFYTQGKSRKSFQKRNIQQHRMNIVNHPNLTVHHPQFHEVLWVTSLDLYKQCETWEFGCDL